MGISKTKIYPKLVFAELNKNYSFYVVISDVRIQMQQIVMGKVMALLPSQRSTRIPALPMYSSDVTVIFTSYLCVVT